ncbi:MAG TPA: sensor domain-containing diguanylate cyclase [Candidatus Hydrogenedentes bacterium]|nr:sensor domain-containing diguanylate cyclase [Candidatus Hydrogenedentota bacterium]HNT88811.1 sensor domain-containing diguanylate cyclase [Candidatus Hydrogenedentota bacterium]
MAQRSRARLGGDYRSLHRQNQMLAKQVDQLSMLREIGLVINRSLELAQTLPDIANVVQGALEVRRLTIYELDEKQNRLRPIIAKYGDDLITAERLEEDSMPFRGTPFEEAVRSGAVLLVAEPHRRAAFVPLMAEYNALGVLLLEDPRDGEPFDPEDRAFFHQLGAQIALAIHNAKLYAMAVTDGLTGLYVRRYFDLRMEEEFDQARRYRRCFSLLMFDIDHFKRFNDAHGHQTGDAVLQQFAQLLRRNTRRADVCCRYGGEEMAVILPETGLAEAARLAEKLRGRIAETVFEGAEGGALSVTSSVGVAAFGRAMTQPEDVVRAADKALYAAKEGGRNRVALASETPAGGE